MLPAPLPLILLHERRGRQALCGQVNWMKLIFNMLWSLLHGDPRDSPLGYERWMHIFVDRTDIGWIKMQPSFVSHSSQHLKHSPSWILKLQNNCNVEMNRLALMQRTQWSEYSMICVLSWPKIICCMHEVSSVINFMWKRITLTEDSANSSLLE